MNPLLAKLARGVDQAFNKKKQESEYLRKKMAEIGGLPPAEQITKLKQMINEQESQQRLLQTKVLKVEKDTEKVSKRLADAQNIKPQSANV